LAIAAPPSPKSNPADAALLSSPAVQLKIARALDVDTAELLPRSRPAPTADPDAGVVALRAALTGLDTLLDEVDTDAEPLTLADAARTLTYAWEAYWSGRYELLAGLLPSALSRVRATLRAAPAAQRPQAAERSAELHQVAAVALVQLGHPDPAFLALREGLAAAEHGEDELRPATLRCSLAWVLLTQGRFAEAHRLATCTAEAVEPAAEAASAHVSVFGSLLLTGGTAAGRDRAAGAAAAVLAEAREAVKRNGQADTTHDINTLTHFGEQLKIVYDDPDGHDKLYRFMESIQEFFDLSSQLEVSFT